MLESPMKAPRGRSPAYPAFGLPKAAEKARLFYQGVRRHKVDINTALKALGYSMSGTGVRAIAALLQFGILEEEGSKEDRTVWLSDLGLKIAQLPEGDPVRQEALSEAAQKPTIYRALLDRWPDTEDLPPDSAMERYLTYERQPPYHEETVGGLLEEFKATFEYAKLGGSAAKPLSPSVPQATVEHHRGERAETGEADPRAGNPSNPGVGSEHAVPGASPDVIGLPIPVSRGRVAHLTMPADITRKEYDRIKSFLDYQAAVMFDEEDV